MNTHEHLDRPIAHAHAHTPEELVASQAFHAHKKGDAKHAHSKEINNQHLLAIALVLTLGFSLVEAIAGSLSYALFHSDNKPWPLGPWPSMNSVVEEVVDDKKSSSSD